MITKKMTFSEILKLKPDCGELLFKHGLHCVGCHMAATETLEEGCKAHGMDDKKIDELVKELNS